MMAIRRYRATDHDAVWELHNLALLDVAAHPGSGSWDDDLHQVETVYIAEGGDFFVGVVDERVVAMGALKRLAGNRAEIRRMRVHPSLQRRGLGREMLLALEQRAAALGFLTLTLETTVGQVAAMEMYVKAAYQEVRRYRHAGFDIVAFEKHI